MQQLEESIQYLQIQQEELLDKADELISVYWAWFTDCNRTIKEQRNAGLTDALSGMYAPVIQRKKSGEGIKPYIMWRKFEPSSIRRLNPKFSKAIKPGFDGGYMTALKKATWEQERAMSLEVKLNQLRLAVNALQSSIVKMRSVKRKIEKETNQQASEV
ncbi:conjugative transfer protein MobI(A/C) [Rheinheimera hassiensis]|uniref:conjugative transfer protein MobI(A/C) n=1 Tax=Rheinheimera hassiensis TaxID=1193627 RepID=UPI001F05447F|nr:conjugative transfer protein MobI(A/C) [Rheinheimera hassiensis]